ncbi:hypothetical protein ACFL6S_07505 [Candidatus Poribacteria bacterium]
MCSITPLGFDTGYALLNRRYVGKLNNITRQSKLDALKRLMGTQEKKLKPVGNFSLDGICFI